MKIFSTKQSNVMGTLATLVLISSMALTQLSFTKETNEEGRMLRHVVLFKFKDNADPAAIKRAEEAFAALPDKIDLIKAFEWGLNNSPEGLNKGMTHCYTLSFASEADRDAYLPHPDHVAFTKLMPDILDDVLVVDYWNK